MNIVAKKTSILSEKADAGLFFLFQDQTKLTGNIAKTDITLKHAISQRLKQEDGFSVGDIFHINSLGTLPLKHIVVIGIGKKNEFHPHVLHHALLLCAKVFEKINAKNIIIELPPNVQIQKKDLSIHVTQALYLAFYRFIKYVTNKKAYRPQITICTPSDRDLGFVREGVKIGSIVGSSADLARDLGNEPSNILTPAEIAIRAQKEFKGTKVRCTILDETQIKKNKMGLIEAVGKGSVHPPRIVVLEYQGGRKSDPYIGLVGKGITFDSGGISLKTGEAMRTLMNMKRDMSGSACVLSVMRAVSHLKLQKNIIGLLSLAENMPDGGSYKPGDILTSYSGKTVEINNTDAEGRLVIADGIAYIQKQYQVKTIIDIATLTGEVAFVFGPMLTAVFCNNNALYKNIKNASRTTGECVWRMPLFKEYEKKIKGDLADIRDVNFDLPNAITSALFLQQFIDNGVSWAHMDIAGSEHVVMDAGKSSVGVGVRLLTSFLMA